MDKILENKKDFAELVGEAFKKMEERINEDFYKEIDIKDFVPVRGYRSRLAVYDDAIGVRDILEILSGEWDKMVREAYIEESNKMLGLLGKNKHL